MVSVIVFRQTHSCLLSRYVITQLANQGNFDFQVQKNMFLQFCYSHASFSALLKGIYFSIFLSSESIIIANSLFGCVHSRWKWFHSLNELHKSLGFPWVKFQVFVWVFKNLTTYLKLLEINKLLPQTETTAQKSKAPVCLVQIGC